MVAIEHVGKRKSSVKGSTMSFGEETVDLRDLSMDATLTIARIRRGVSPLIVRRLGEIGVDAKYQIQIIPARTLQRRIAQGELLTPSEGERAIRFARIIAEADRVFGDHEKGLRWLKSPKKKLEGQAPLDLMDTDLGVQLVQNMLGQIDEGYFA